MTDIPMTDEHQFSVVDVPGYPAIYDAIDDWVHSDPHPRLAAAAVLNAACSVLLTTMDAEMLADLLRRTAARIPAEEAKARGNLN